MPQDYSEVEALLEEAKEAGVDPDAAAEWLDKLVDFNAVLPAPAGAVAEAVDGAVYKAAIKGLGKLGKRIVAIITDPEQRERRRAKRAARKAARKARREEP